MIDIENVKRLSLRDGEILVLQVAANVSAETLDNFAKSLEASFPSLKGKVLMEDQSISLTVVQPKAAA
jgi:hypothetical protein